MNLHAICKIQVMSSDSHNGSIELSILKKKGLCDFD